MNRKYPIFDAATHEIQFVNIDRWIEWFEQHQLDLLFTDSLGSFSVVTRFIGFGGQDAQRHYQHFKTTIYSDKSQTQVLYGRYTSVDAARFGHKRACDDVRNGTIRL